jgi:hypothetical protein
MRPPTSSVPVGFRVQRRYEGNRLAEDCQARAYEQAVPTVDRFDGAVPLPVPDADNRVGVEPVQVKGVAA